jgi:UDPglucose 6-dehydrogenase
MKVAVIGTGYVGLVAGTCFAETGHNVVCVDKQADVVAQLKRGTIHIYEPGLEELVVRNLEEERLQFTTSVRDAVESSLIVFLCVGTPLGPDGKADLTQVFEAAEAIGDAMSGYRIIVSKSTCPVGTLDEVRKVVAARTKHPFDVVSNPEFLKEGNAVDDFLRPDRVVIGCDDVRVSEIMRELYAPFVRTGKPILVMDIRSAELTKYACNTLLATRVSLMNELATIAESCGADISSVREGVAADSRIGAAFLFPGLGFGGSCFPKDVQALSYLATAAGVPAHLLEATIQVNQEQRARFLRRILDHYGDGIAGKKIAVWGASFKPRTDDIREAPALLIIEGLLDAGAKIAVYDPVAGSNVHLVFGDRIEVAAKYYQALEDADGLVICTEWNEFRRPDYARMAHLMRERVIFDGRNIYTPKVMAEAGFRYFSIGRSNV